MCGAIPTCGKRTVTIPLLMLYLPFLTAPLCFSLIACCAHEADLVVLYRYQQSPAVVHLDR